MNSFDLLRKYAEQYENADFLNGDPSWFMHHVQGTGNQEAMAFVAAALSYGSRPQFMKKIEAILRLADGQVDRWVRSGQYRDYFHEGDRACFYRLYNHNTMHGFLATYQQLMLSHGTLGSYARRHATDALTAIEAITRFFNSNGNSLVVPKNTQSACKRLCMFLRWMVRSNSPVDLGLWADFIDRRTLIMPLDTHVLSQSVRLGLLTSKTANMTTARRLTSILSEVFPDDPLKGDFALFGYGVNH